MAGRKAIYQPELLEVGDRIELKGSKKPFGHQYAYNWAKKVRRTAPDRDFKCITIDGKVFIERII